MIVNGDQLSIFVEARLDRMHVGRPVAAAPHVVLSGPLHLDRRFPTKRARRSHSLDDQVGIPNRSAAEATAGLHDVQPDLVGRHTADLRCDCLVEIGRLMAAPHLDDAVFAHPRDRVERLQRCVREVGELVMRFDGLGGGRKRGRHVTVVARRGCSRAVRQLAVFRQDFGRPALFGLRLVPFHRHQVTALQRRPHVAADDGDAARRLDDIDDAVERLCFRRVEALKLGAEFGRMNHDRRQQAVHLQVDGVGLSAVCLASRIVAFEPVRPDLRPFRLRLQRHVVGNRHPGRRRSEFAEGRALP